MIFHQNISRDLFSQKYMINGETTPDQVFHDIAVEISRPEKPGIRLRVQNEFESIMTEGYFIPGGRICLILQHKMLLATLFQVIEHSRNGSCG